MIRVQDPPGTLDSNTDENDVFSWTYTLNRHWGERSEGDWQIYMENYSGEGFVLGNMQLIFHGQDVGPSERMLGFVEDSGGYLNHGSDVTVYVKDSAGNRVSQFITGADGNFYFDIGMGTNYTLGVDIPAGYKLADGEMKEVPLEDGHIFHIEPLVVQQTDVSFTGQIFADLNGNGIKDATDAGVKNFVVYLDINHNGQFESAEPKMFSVLPTVPIRYPTTSPRPRSSRSASSHHRDGK